MGLRMTAFRVCSTEGSAQGTWVSMASAPCPACPAQPEEKDPDFSPVRAVREVGGPTLRPNRGLTVTS